MSRKGELLRTQAVQSILTALGAAQVNLYINYPRGAAHDDGERSSGVTLVDENTLHSEMYWASPTLGEGPQFDIIRFRTVVTVHVEEMRVGP